MAVNNATAGQKQINQTVIQRSGISLPPALKLQTSIKIVAFDALIHIAGLLIGRWQTKHSRDHGDRRLIRELRRYLQCARSAHTRIPHRIITSNGKTHLLAGEFLKHLAQLVRDLFVLLPVLSRLHIVASLRNAVSALQ